MLNRVRVKKSTVKVITGNDRKPGEHNILITVWANFTKIRSRIWAWGIL